MSTMTGSAGRAVAACPVGSFVHTNRLPGSPDAAASAVKRAHQRGELLRIRKGLYFKGTRTRYGLTRPSAELVAAEVLGPTGSGPTGFSAARAFGLTTQVPARPAIAVTGAVPTSVPGVDLSRRNNLRRIGLNPLEIALLELLRGAWETTVDGGWTDFAGAVATAVGNNRIRWDEVVWAAAGERSPAVRTNIARLEADLGTAEQVG